jgi:hypothetical protein
MTISVVTENVISFYIKKYAGNLTTPYICFLGLSGLAGGLLAMQGTTA